MADHVIGVDVGSQSVKAALLDPEGRTLATAGSPCTMLHPQAGWAEQDPADWVRALGEAVRAVVATAGIRGADVSHLGLACQVDGVVAVDERHEPLRNAIIWLDRRADAQVDVLTDKVGADTIFTTTGLAPDASHTAPKMMWLRDHEPEVFRAARSLPPVAGYLLARLTGVLAQDHANASSSLVYDVTTATWSDLLLDAAGLDVALQAPIRRSDEVAGELLPAAAELLGLSPGCRVIVGTGDEHAATLGAGAVGQGVIVDVTGTAEPVTAPADAAVLDPERLVETHAHAAPGRLLVENPGFVSGGSTKWLAESVLGVDQGAVFDLAGRAPAGADGVIFLPALSGSMAPRWNENMRGGLTGLAMNHDGRHLARAVLEGCAFALRDIVDRLEALGLGGEEVRVVGGGARSRLWLEIKAGVLGRPVRPVLAEEATALGAALLAGTAAGTFTDLDDAVARAVELAPTTIDPDPAQRERYDAAYAQYRGLFDAVEGRHYMINFVFMLTHHDRTVGNAEAVLAELPGTGLAYVGCKDVGATPERLRGLVARAHADGLEMMLEVVSTSRDDELASIRAAVDAGFDWVLGGTHAADGAALLAGSGIRYCPFPGRIVGHPSVLEGEIDEIARSAAELTALDGVHGVDLLTYRHPTADAGELTSAVVAAAAGPVIAAGSVVDADQISTLAKAGAWGFTIGGAIFEGRLPGGPDVAAQVRAVVDLGRAA